MNDAEKITALMKARNLSQNAFAKQTGVAQSYISYIINGKQKITEKIAKKICLALDVDMSYFQEEPKPIETEEMEPVNNDQPNIISSDDTELYGDIISLAIQITDLRNQLVEKIKTDRDKDKYYNGIDQDFLHHIENLDKLTDTQAIDIILKEKESRKNRRTVKNRVFLIQGLLNSMTNPNLYQFVLNGIDKTKNFEYKPRNEMYNNGTNWDM